jgi:hypothetical protein
VGLILEDLDAFPELWMLPDVVQTGQAAFTHIKVNLTIREEILESDACTPTIQKTEGWNVFGFECSTNHAE